MPLAAPVWLGGTAWTTRLPSAAKASPIPTPRSAALISMSYGCPWATASRPKDSAVIPLPTITASLEPKRRATRPATDPSRLMPSAAGNRYRPATTTEAPKPNPVLVGSWANCGKTRNEAYMPAPSRNATRLVVHTPRMRIIAMSMSGSSLCSSTMIQAAVVARPKASSPIVLGEPQPQVIVSEIAMSTQQKPTDMRAAASQLTRPGTRTGDSGTNSWVQIAAARVTISGIQNSQW